VYAYSTERVDGTGRVLFHICCCSCGLNHGEDWHTHGERKGREWKAAREALRHLRRHEKRGDKVAPRAFVALEQVAARKGR